MDGLNLQKGRMRPLTRLYGAAFDSDFASCFAFEAFIMAGGWLVFGEGQKLFTMAEALPSSAAGAALAAPRLSAKREA
jgi:hypothetical protein